MRPARVGFTGTREGMTAPQSAALAAYLYALCREGPDTIKAHHGGAVGADREFHSLCRDLWGYAARIVVHPADDLPQALCDWTDADDFRPPVPHRDRNEAVARHGLDVLLACPRRPELHPDSRRSGTWQTVRIARGMGRRVVVFLHGGEAMT